MTLYSYSSYFCGTIMYTLICVLFCLLLAFHSGSSIDDVAEEV